MRTAPVKKIATVLAAGSLLLGGAALAPAASAATPVTAAAAPAAAPAAVVPDAGTRTSLVTAWYEQFLGRSPDAGAQYWVVRLRTETPGSVLIDLLRTPEAVGKQVGDLYTTFLGRTPEGDPAADVWYGGIQRAEFPAEWAEQNILASAEYAARVSAPDPQRGPQLVVAQWYRDLLGREAGAGEVEYWSIQLEDQSRLDVLRDIWYSPEAVNLRVASHYEDYLQRPADPAEISYWFDAEVVSDVAVVIAIASSAEYQANSPTFLP